MMNLIHFKNTVLQPLGKNNFFCKGMAVVTPHGALSSVMTRCNFRCYVKNIMNKARFYIANPD